MKNILLLFLTAILCCCVGADTMTHGIGSKTTFFYRKVYQLSDSTIAIVEHRHTKSLILYDSLVTDSRNKKVLFYREKTEDKEALTCTDTYYK